MFKNNIFTHKILLIIGLVFFILFVFTMNCFASDDVYEDIVFTYNGVTYNISNPANFSNDFAQRYCIFLRPDGGISFAYSENASTTFIGYKDINNFDRVETGGQFYYGDITNNEWIYRGYVPTGGFYESKGFIVYSNQDIIYDNEGNVFFQIPPQGTQVQLMKPMEVEEIPQLITKLLIILVPVGLTIFGALLLLYLLGSRKWLMH